jgi:copper transport protein
MPRWAILGAVVASTLMLMTTWTLGGHAAAGMQTPAAMISDLLHVFAMTVWLGGLALLTISLRPAEHAAELAAVLPRFSRVAFGCVLVLVTTGSYQTWREVGSVDALRNTSFGRLLLLKLLAVLVVVSLGNQARRWVQRHLTPPGRSWRLPALLAPAITAYAASAPAVERAPEITGQQGAAPYGPLQLRQLRRGLIAELGIAVIVLGITVALVVSVPSRQSYVRPFTRTVTATGLQLAVRIDTPRTGDAVLQVIARSSDGKAVTVTGIRGSLTQPEAKLGPLPLRLPTADGATSTGKEDIGLTFPRKGKWVLQLTVQTSPLDATAFSFTVPVT